MKTRALALVAAVCFCSAIASVAPARASVCSSDYAFKGDMGRWVYAAEFAATVDNARSLEKQHLYVLLHKQFASQAAAPSQALSTPCTSSASFTDAVHRAAAVQGSLRRVTSLIARFPMKRAAPQARWRPVLRSATTGAVAALELAKDIGISSSKVTQLATQLTALRLELKQSA